MNNSQTLIEFYISVQKKYEKKYGKDVVVIIEVGSFYEVYEVNEIGKAREISYLLNMILTKKNKNIHDISIKNPYMTGFPSLSLSKNLAKINESSKYTIVVISQKGVAPNITREVTDIISPGTYVPEHNHKNNFLMSIFIENYNSDAESISIGLSVSDISTGEVYISESHTDKERSINPYDKLSEFLSRFNPSEVSVTFLNFSKKAKSEFIERINQSNIAVTTNNYTKETYNLSNIDAVLSKTYPHANTSLTMIEFLSLETMQYGINALIDSILFLNSHNPSIVKGMSYPVMHDQENVMMVSPSGLQHLDIIGHGNSRDNNSVMSFIDKTKTCMGSRMLRMRISYPLTNVDEINARLNEVEVVAKNDIYKGIRSELSQIIDIQRVVRRVLSGNSAPNDIYLIFKSAEAYLGILNNDTNPKSLGRIKPEVDKVIKKLSDIFIIDNMKSTYRGLVEEPIFSNKQNDVYQLISEQITVDKKMNNVLNEVKALSVKTTSGIRIESTPKNGYYISMTRKAYRSYSKFLPEHKVVNSSSKSKIFIDKITSLGKQKDIIISDITKVSISEYDDASEIFISEYRDSLDNICRSIASLDIACSTAYLSIENNYHKPEIIDGDESSVVMENLRHPVIEQIIKEDFVTNNISSIDTRGHLIFGVNATGKSTILKSVGISIIMSQSGMFIPVKAKITPFKKLFTRFPSKDNIFKGHSTFTIEMLELKSILSNSDKNTMVLADELSHGTETASGVSILAATIGYLTKKSSSFLFTTHLHQVVDLEVIKNNTSLRLSHLSVEYKSGSDEIIYNRKLLPGSGSPVYGITVARGMGLPDDFIKDAGEILSQVTNRATQRPKNNKYNAKKVNVSCEICNHPAIHTHHIEYKSVAINGHTPGGKTNRVSNLIGVCESCHSLIHKDQITDICYKTTTTGLKLFYKTRSVNPIIPINVEARP